MWLGQTIVALLVMMAPLPHEVTQVESQRVRAGVKANPTKTKPANLTPGTLLPLIAQHPTAAQRVMPGLH